jgi:hypothetical protein
MYLSTYSTVPQKKNGSRKGFSIDSDCKCNSVFDPMNILIASAIKYDVNIDCQWIGRSFESFYFSNDCDGESGIYENATPYRKYSQAPFLYTPSSWSFSGWSDEFYPGNYLLVKTIEKNTATQEEVEKDVYVFVMNMTWNWTGGITVDISSSYNGDVTGVNTSIGTATEALSNAVNDGVVDADRIEGGSFMRDIVYLTTSNLVSNS